MQCSKSQEAMIGFRGSGFEIAVTAALASIQTYARPCQHSENEELHKSRFHAAVESSHPVRRWPLPVNSNTPPCYLQQASLLSN